MSWKFILFSILSFIQTSPPKIQWDISHCVDEIISPGVGVEQHSKVIVSRYYPSPMGNNWQCEYKIQNPDSTTKVMVEFLFFDLARCELQNVTVVDWGTKNAVGPFCGTETPPRWLSGSNQIRVFVKSGEIPDGLSHVGFMMKVTRAPKGFEAEFNQMKMEEEMAKNPQMGMGAMGGMGGMGFPYPMAGGRLGPLGGGMGMGGGMSSPMGGALGGKPGMRPGMGGRMGPRRPGAPGTRRGMGAGIGPGKRPGSGPRRGPSLAQGPVQQWSGSGPPHLSASYQRNMQKDIGASQYSEAAVRAINNYKKRIGTNLPDEAKKPMSPPSGMGGGYGMGSGMMGQGMMGQGQAGMNPMMANMMANMMGMQPSAPVTTAPPTQSMEIVNGIPMLVSNPAAVPQSAPMQPAMPDQSYPAALQPLPDDAFSSNSIKRANGIPVKTNVPKSYLDKISAQPDFARIPPGAGAAQNKKPKIHHSMNEGIMPWNDKSQGNQEATFWSMEKIIGIVAGVIILISASVIGIMCCLRARTKEQNREYKEREKINAARKYERNTLTKKLKTISRNAYLSSDDSDLDSTDKTVKKLEKKLQKKKTKLSKV